jgi:hypothetical protein
MLTAMRRGFRPARPGGFRSVRAYSFVRTCSAGGGENPGRERFARTPSAATPGRVWLNDEW